MLPPLVTFPTTNPPCTPAPEVVISDSDKPTHADYDLYPLPVQGLGHYTTGDEESERFHVR